MTAWKDSLYSCRPKMKISTFLVQISIVVASRIFLNENRKPIVDDVIEPLYLVHWNASENFSAIDAADIYHQWHDASAATIDKNHDALAEDFRRQMACYPGPPLSNQSLEALELPTVPSCALLQNASKVFLEEAMEFARQLANSSVGLTSLNPQTPLFELAVAQTARLQNLRDFLPAGRAKDKVQNLLSIVGDLINNVPVSQLIPRLQQVWKTAANGSTPKYQDSSVRPFRFPNGTRLCESNQESCREISESRTVDGFPPSDRQPHRQKSPCDPLNGTDIECFDESYDPPRPGREPVVGSLTLDNIFDGDPNPPTNTRDMAKILAGQYSPYGNIEESEDNNGTDVARSQFNVNNFLDRNPQPKGKAARFGMLLQGSAPPPILNQVGTDPRKFFREHGNPSGCQSGNCSLAMHNTTRSPNCTLLNGPCRPDEPSSLGPQPSTPATFVPSPSPATFSCGQQNSTAAASFIDEITDNLTSGSLQLPKKASDFTGLLTTMFTKQQQQEKGANAQISGDAKAKLGCLVQTVAENPRLVDKVKKVGAKLSKSSVVQSLLNQNGKETLKAISDGNFSFIASLFS